MRKLIILIIAILIQIASYGQMEKEGKRIDRKSVVARNNPHIASFDSLSSLSVGNGHFAYTVDFTGLQTYPDRYAEGIPLGTQSEWGWHSFPNFEKYTIEETLKEYDLGHGSSKALYAVQFDEKGRNQEAADYFRANPHRLHLGIVGLEMTDASGNPIQMDAITSIGQTLNLWDGIIDSHFIAAGLPVKVQTVCHPQNDAIAAKISSALIETGQLKIKFRFPYPTGNHTDDACDWNKPGFHQTRLIEKADNYVLLQRILDETVYYVRIDWTGKAMMQESAKHYFLLTPEEDNFSFSVTFAGEKPLEKADTFEQTLTVCSDYWRNFWNTGGFIDFSSCKDPRAKELERRVILSQYLTAIQCAGSMPPQETGLTYNSWFGKFHLEMHWWHAVHFALWNRIDLMERSLDWYAKVEPIAKQIAERQGFEGVRWMKMTDPSGTEAPSNIGSFLIWQQPHFIYMAELIYRQKPTADVLEKYKDLVFKTADFMSSFAEYDKTNKRYLLKGLIPAQETLSASETVNPPFELSYWHYALNAAQQWRVRAGLERNPRWDEIIQSLSPLASKDGLYLAAETASDTYGNPRYTSDHPAVLGALGILPENNLFEKDIMKNTLHWIWNHWNWDQTWGWDYPMIAMCAARLGEPEIAVGALLMDKRTNTCLVNGHNYQDEHLRVYLPGNGGLLTAVAMMCAGWDNCVEKNPGFPKDGNWDVKWEDLAVMP